MISGATSQWRRYRVLGVAAAGSTRLRDHPEGPPRLGEADTRDDSSERGFHRRDRPRAPDARHRRVLGPEGAPPGQDRGDQAGGDLRRPEPRSPRRNSTKLCPSWRRPAASSSTCAATPNGIAPQTIGHLIDHPVTCAQWHIPVTYSPDRRDVAFSFSNWPVQPEGAAFQGQGRVPDRRAGHQLRGDLPGRSSSTTSSPTSSGARRRAPTAMSTPSRCRAAIK